MTSFILDGTALPFPKVDLVPLGSAPANKYSVASDWNTVCQASIDMQTFLRGNFLLFMNGDPTTRAALLLSNGAPVVTAAKGSLALDITTPAVYQNQDGVATWLPLAGGGGSMAIGAPVTGGTLGSMLYVGASTFLQQDNANLYFDNVNKRVGIGNSAPGTTLDLSSATTVAGLAMRAGSTTAVSGASTGRLRYNEGTQRFQVSMNGAAYADVQTGADFTLDIGDAIGSSTIGSVLFVGAGNVLQQDNASLFFDNTNNRLGVGTATPGAVSLVGHAIFSARSNADVLEIKSTAADGYSTLWFTDSADVHQTSFGFGNATVAIVRLRGKQYLYGPNDFLIDDTTATAMAFKPTANNVSFEMFNGGSGAVSSANAGRLRYTTAGQKFQVSYNGAAYVDLATGTGMAIGTTITSATAGSVLFAGAAGILQQDNANFFWDDTNNRLGIGTSAPNAPFHVRTGTSPNARFERTTATTNDITTAMAIKGTSTGDMANGFGPVVTFQIEDTAAVNNDIAQIAAQRTGGADNTGDLVFYTSLAGVLTQRVRVNSDGGLQVSASTAAVSAASTGRLRYDSGSQKLQLSNNTDTYAEIARNAAALTAGSIAFAGGTGLLAQDNANLFFDDTNNRLGIGTNLPGTTLDIASATTVAGLALYAGSTTPVSAASTGRVRYNEGTNRFQLSANGTAYFDLVSTAPTVERLSVDGAADPAKDVTYVSGTGTDLTLANGTVDGFIKTFVITGGDGTITPTNLADGNVLTWTAGPANVSFIWDATGVSWHVHGNPYNMVTT